MEKTKLSAGETLKLKSTLKRRSSFIYNVFNGRKITRIVDVTTIKEAQKLDEDMVNKFRVDGPFKVIVVEGRFGETFISYSKLSKYIQ